MHDRMHEYVYVWDRKNDRCAAVWYVKPKGMRAEDAPANTRGAIEETEFDERIRQLLLKYPEPRYLVDGGESSEADGQKAAAELRERVSFDEEE